MGIHSQDRDNMKIRKSKNRACNSRRRVTAGMLLSFLALASQVDAAKAPAIDPWYPLPAPKQHNTHDFTSRSASVEIERLVDRQPYNIERYLEYARYTGSPAVLDATDWTMDEVKGPNVSDKDTVLNLAIMGRRICRNTRRRRLA